MASALGSNELGVIINDADPLSIKIGNYYRQQRNIPDSNMIHVRFSPGSPFMPVNRFRILMQQINRQAGKHIQAFALTWAAPFRVGCMSLTSAIALGYNKTWCASGCRTTKASSYFNHRTTRPFSKLGIRPTMALAAKNFEHARQLIDRGIAADGSFPKGTAYLVSTTDKARNVRSHYYAQTAKALGKHINVSIIHTNALENRHDILFYFTGKKHVTHLRSNRFLPGAIADHLTSSGGNLLGLSQMSAMRWLEAGTTGSYGTVIEPCNYPQKFPFPQVAISHYLSGNTLIEAYWKSVLMPGQGLFIGEPLSRPFSPHWVPFKR